MAKDKSKAFIYAASFTANGASHKMYFRKEEQRMDFVNRVAHLVGVSNASIDVGVYVYEHADTALNIVANYTNRITKKDAA